MGFYDIDHFQMVRRKSNFASGTLTKSAKKIASSCFYLTIFALSCHTNTRKERIGWCVIMRGRNSDAISLRHLASKYIRIAWRN